MLYGVLTEKDLATQRVTEVGVDVVMDAVDQSLMEHNRQMDALMSLFVTRTTKFKTRFQTNTAARLQPLDASGRARPIKPGGYYDLAFPLQMAGAAWGTDYVTGIKMRVEEVARIVKQMQSADMRWLRDHILAALFYKSSTNPWTFADPAHGDLSIYGLANGDSVTYELLRGADQNATDDHLLGASSLTASVFETIYNELTEHPENEGEAIAFIPTASKSTVEGLTGYIPVDDANVRVGANTATLRNALTTPLPGNLIGYLEKCWIVEWRSMPDDYAIGCMTGGDRALAMREDEEPELQGFKEVAQRGDHPWTEKQWLRRAGFGGWNRVGAVAHRTNNATYAVPTNYSSPMP